LFNLNMAWSQIQLVEFRIMKQYEFPRDQLDDLGLISVLKSHSAQDELENLINQFFGEELGNEILAVLKKWNINLVKFIERQRNKGQNILIGIGKMLGLADYFDAIVQCRCGEVMGFSSGLINFVKKLYPDGNVQCNKCDATQISRLKQLGYPGVMVDHSILFGYALEHLAKDRSPSEKNGKLNGNK